MHFEGTDFPSKKENKRRHGSEYLNHWPFFSSPTFMVES